MITLAEWSRRRPPPPAFGGFGAGLDFAPEIDDSGAIEVDGLIDDLLGMLQVAARVDAQNVAEAIQTETVRKVGADMDSKIAVFTKRAMADLTTHFNAVLKPWLGKQIEEQALSAFCTAVSAALGDELSREVATEVPEGLRSRLEARFAKEGIKAAMSDSNDQELHAKLGHTSITTEISVWQERLNSVLP